MQFKGPNQKFKPITQEEINESIKQMKAMQKLEEMDPDALIRKFWEMMNDLDVEEILAATEQIEDKKGKRYENR